MAKVTLQGRLVSNIFKKKAQETTGKEKYWVQVVLNDGEIDKLRKVKQEVLKEVFEDKIPQGSGLSDYVERKGDDPEYDLTFNNYFVRSSTDKPVKCYIKHSPKDFKQVTQEEAPLHFYAGAYVAVSLDIYAKTKAEAANMGGKAFISSGVRGLLFVRDGEQLGDGNVTEEEFAGLQSELSEDDFDA